MHKKAILVKASFEFFEWESDGTYKAIPTPTDIGNRHEIIIAEGQDMESVIGEHVDAILSGASVEFDDPKMATITHFLDDPANEPGNN